MEAAMAQQDAIERASELVVQSRYLVALVGAGIECRERYPYLSR